MWPSLLLRYFVRHGYKVQLPFVCLVGFLGYYIEGKISDRYTPGTAPIKQQREERLLEDIDSVPGIPKHNPLEVNLSPSLST